MIFIANFTWWEKAFVVVYMSDQCFFTLCGSQTDHLWLFSGCWSKRFDKQDSNEIGTEMDEREAEASSGMQPCGFS